MLKDKVIIITGAGSGLGQALALAFCKEQATVIGLGRNKQSLSETKKLASEDRFSFYEADVSNTKSLRITFDSILSEHQRIDYLFNNAAIYPQINFLDEKPEDFFNAMNINIIGVSNCCKLALPTMMKNNFGRIYNIGSWADKNPIANSAAYSSSKGALHALTKAIAADIADSNADIQIHEWIPGALNTQMGIPTGIETNQAASWAVHFTKSNIQKNHCVFERDKEWLPPKSFKQKLLSKLSFK